MCENYYYAWMRIQVEEMSEKIDLTEDDVKILQDLKRMYDLTTLTT